MIPVKTDVVEKQGNMSGEKVTMRLDENSLEHLQTLLTDLYSDPELAVIREYSTNGSDAQIESGYVGPIHITLPSALNSVFVCQDFGVGLSVNDIKNVYSLYGASTKRETNEQTGVLGLGAKSALQGSDNFTVESVKNGCKVVAVVSRNEQGVGEISIIDTVATDEHNGTKITVPVKNFSSFNQKAENFFRFWKSGTVLVNGKEPNHIVGEEIAPGMRYVEGLTEDYFVMGNVSYKVYAPASVQNTYRSYNYGIVENRPYGNASYGIVVDIAMGDVTFTPSREELSYTPRTLKVVEKFREEYKKNLKDFVLRNIQEAKTKAASLDAYKAWHSRLPNGVLPTRTRTETGMKYKGSDIPAIFLADVYVWNRNATRYAIQHSDRLDLNFNLGTYNPPSSTEILIVNGYDGGESITPTIKKKTLQYLEENSSTDYRRIVFARDFSSDQKEWLAGSEMINFSTIKKLKLPKKVGIAQATSSAGKFKIATKGGWVDEVEKLEAKNIFYFSPSEIGEKNSRDVNYAAYYSVLPSDSTIVIVPINRHKTFVQAIPKAKSLTEHVKGLGKGIKLTESDSIRQHYSGWNLGLRDSHINELDDPYLANFIKTALSDKSEDHKKWEKLLRVPGKRGLPLMPQRPDSPILEYSMFEHNYYISRVPQNHIVLYINAVYNEIIKPEQEAKANANKKEEK